MDAAEDAGALLPEQFAIERIGGDDDFLAIEEGAEDALAITCGRGGGVAVFLVNAFARGLHDDLFPELLAGGAIEADERAFASLGCRRDGEKFSAKDDGRGVAFAGEFGAPEDVVALAPRGRERGLGAASVIARAAPHGPVLGERGG